jgi:hypothetical protein
MPKRVASIIAEIACVVALCVGCESPRHKLIVDIVLESGDAGVGFVTQNGSMAYIEPSALSAKPYFWVTTNMGDSFANGIPLEAAGGSLSPDLTAHFETGANYHDGPVELSLFVSLSGGDASRGAKEGDLGAVDNSDQPKGEPGPTGRSVRVHIEGGDADVALLNQHFIRL